MKSLLIIGSGGHGRIIAETALHMGTFKLLGFTEDDPAKVGSTVQGLPVLGGWQDQTADLVIIGVGHNQVRARIYDALVAAGRQLALIVSPRAYVSPQASLGPGTVVLAGAVVQNGSAIGANTIINAGAVVDHEAIVANHSHIGINALIMSYTHVPTLDYVRAGEIRSGT